MKLTKKKIQEVLNNFREADEDGFNELVYGDNDVELEGLKFESEEEVGGEGQGDHAHTVIKVTSGEETAYIKFDAYYSSYDGRDYGDCDFDLVEPYNRTIRDWKIIK